MSITTERKQRELKLREDLILDTAAAMFSEQGYLNLNLDKLAEKVQYSKGTLYQHFETKEDLLLAVAGRSLEQRQILFQRAAGFSGRARERMCAIGIADRIFVYNHPSIFKWSS